MKCLSPHRNAKSPTVAKRRRNVRRSPNDAASYASFGRGLPQGGELPAPHRVCFPDRTTQWTYYNYGPYERHGGPYEGELHFSIGVPRDAQWHMDNDMGGLTTKILAIFGLQVVRDDDPNVEDGIVRVEFVGDNRGQARIFPYDTTLSIPPSEQRKGVHTCEVKTINIPHWWEHNEYDRDVLGEVCRYLNIPVTQFTTRDILDDSQKTVTALTDFTTEAISRISRWNHEWDGDESRRRRHDVDITGLWVDSYYVGDVPDVLRILATLFGLWFEPRQTKDHNVVWILRNHSITEPTLANLRPFLVSGLP